MSRGLQKTLSTTAQRRHLAARNCTHISAGTALSDAQPSVDRLNRAVRSRRELRSLPQRDCCGSIALWRIAPGRVSVERGAAAHGATGDGVHARERLSAARGGGHRAGGRPDCSVRAPGMVNSHAAEGARTCRFRSAVPAISGGICHAEACLRTRGVAPVAEAGDRDATGTRAVRQRSTSGRRD